jgi:hypothetical protein
VIVRIVDESGPSGIAYPEDDDAAGPWLRRGIEQLLAPRLQTSTHGRSTTRAHGPTRNCSSSSSGACSRAQHSPPCPARIGACRRVGEILQAEHA